LREAAAYLAARPEAAEALPLHAAPAELASLLSEMLVEEGAPRSPYEALEAKLLLRDLDARCAEVGRETQRAAAAGDDDEVRRLQREKIELDRAREHCRRQVGT
jgi:hypothetical protein